MGSMLSGLFNYYLAHWLWTVPLSIAVVLAAFLLWMKYTNDLWWTDFWVVFPVFGKMRKWVQDTHGIGDKSTWEKDGMPRPEVQLCSEYLDRQKDPAATKEVFDRAKEYLKLTHQSDITPTSKWMWILLIILTVAEATGTGLLIAPFVASEITGNQMIWIGYIIALVMAAGLLGLTHYAGSQAHKFGTIRNHIGKVGRAHDDLITQPVECGDDQAQDEIIPGRNRAQTAKIRFANRALEGAHDRGTLAWVLVVVLVLAALLGGITWMRIEGIRIQMTKQSSEQAQSGGGSAANPFAGIPGMSDNIAAPDTVAKSSNEAHAKVRAELNQEKFSQGIAGSIVLALIYLITQGLGFLHALRHSFVGSGHKAYKLTRGEASYKTYENKYVMPLINKAQKRLEYLRARLAENSDYRENPSTMSCFDYFLKQQSERENRLRSAEPTQATAKAGAAGASAGTPEGIGVSTGSGDSDEVLVKEARKILSEKDAKMRKKLLDYASDGLDEKRDKLLEAIKFVKDSEARLREEQQMKLDRAELEDSLLKD